MPSLRPGQQSWEDCWAVGLKKEDERVLSFQGLDLRIHLHHHGAQKPQYPGGVHDWLWLKMIGFELFCVSFLRLVARVLVHQKRAHVLEGFEDFFVGIHHLVWGEHGSEGDLSGTALRNDAEKCIWAN